MSSENDKTEDPDSKDDNAVVGDAAKEPDDKPSAKSSAPAKKSSAEKAASAGTVKLKARRQDGIEKADTRRWEELDVATRDGMTVLELLEEARSAAAKAGTQPFAFEGDCHEELCGACTMLINGKVQLACATLVKDASPKGKAITLEPLSKFPLVRDLVTDRSRIEEPLRKVQAWIAIDELEGSGEVAPESQAGQGLRAELARCIDCAACLEACPQYGDHGEFVGAAAISSARLANLHPAGALQRNDRVATLMAPGGVADCGKSQNCIEVCPAGIPLTESIASMSRQATKRLLFGWLDE